jgi:hypothetical protein
MGTNTQGGASLRSCGNGVLDVGEECDSNARAFCESDCTLAPSVQCAPENNAFCCSAAGVLLGNETACPASPRYPFLPASFRRCPDACSTPCFPPTASHPCEKFSNLIPCQVSQNQNNASSIFKNSSSIGSEDLRCRAGCALDSNPTVCLALAPGPGSIDTAFLPDGTCCDSSGDISSGGSSESAGRCLAGNCTARFSGCLGEDGVSRWAVGARAWFSSSERPDCERQCTCSPSRCAAPARVGATAQEILACWACSNTTLNCANERPEVTSGGAAPVVRDVGRWSLLAVLWAVCLGRDFDLPS